MLAPNTVWDEKAKPIERGVGREEGTLRLARWSAYRAGCHVIARELYDVANHTRSLRRWSST